MVRASDTPAEVERGQRWCPRASGQGKALDARNRARRTCPTRRPSGRSGQAACPPLPSRPSRRSPMSSAPLSMGCGPRRAGTVVAWPGHSRSCAGSVGTARRPHGGQHVTVVDEDHGGTKPGQGERLLEGVGQPPVRGGQALGSGRLGQRRHVRRPPQGRPPRRLRLRHPPMRRPEPGPCRNGHRPHRPPAPHPDSVPRHAHSIRAGGGEERRWRVRPRVAPG